MAFDTESGLFTNYKGTVTSASFGYDARVNNGGTLCLFLNMATDSDDPAFTEWTERYTCGGEWMTPDGGDSAFHPQMERNANKKFNKNSQMGRFIEAIKSCNGAVQALSSRGDEFHAKTFVGSKWKMEPVKSSFTNQETKERVDVERNYPSAFLGFVGESGSNGASSAPASTAVDIDEPTLAELRTLANSLSYQEWADKAVNLLGDQIKTQPGLLSAIGSESGLYAELKRA